MITLVNHTVICELGEDPYHTTFNALHKLELERVMQSDDRVVIKPNLCSNKPASTGITTHPEVVEAIIDWITPKARSISIVESNVTATKLTPEINFRDCGYADLSQRKDVRLIDLSKAESTTFILDNGLVRKKHDIAKTLLEADVIINVPVLKTNNLTAVTLGIKNLYGLWGGNKWEFHDDIWDVIDRTTLQINRMIDNIILDLFAIFKPKLKLIVVDGIVGSDGYFGVAWGHPRNTNVICAGYDLFSVERVATQLVGIDPSKLSYMRKGEDQGLGSFKDKIFVEGATLSEIQCDFDLGIKESLKVQDAIFDGYRRLEDIVKVLDVDEAKIKYILKGLDQFGYISLKENKIKIQSRLYMNYLLTKTALVG